MGKVCFVRKDGAFREIPKMVLLSSDITDSNKSDVKVEHYFIGKDNALGITKKGCCRKNTLTNIYNMVHSQK